MIDEFSPAAELAAEVDDAPPPPAPRPLFDDLPLEPELRQAIAEMGYLYPTPVQSAVFDPVLNGRDIMVESRTGTGKTAAFGIPIVQKLESGVLGAQVLCLAPTRELAVQVHEEMKRICKYKSISVCAIYGGAAMGPQIEALEAGVQIIVGTPGRVLDHIRRRTFKTDKIKHLVLDECDEMLSMGFQEEIENILRTLPPREERQTLLFSATIPDSILRIARRHMRTADRISLIEGDVSVAEITHAYYMVSGMAKTRDLLKVIRAEKPESAIIFCNTRDDTNTVARFLMKSGLDAEAISSDLTQKDRERVMKRSRDKDLAYLVATDIAARGIDISDLSHVINYTFPDSPEIYVHRTGRTGRAGKHGTAISLIGPRDIGGFYMLKKTYKIRPVERELPTAEELQMIIEGEQCDQVVKMVAETPSATYLSLARRLMATADAERVVGVLLERLLVAPAPAPRPSAVPPPIPMARRPVERPAFEAERPSEFALTTPLRAIRRDEIDDGGEGDADDLGDEAAPAAQAGERGEAAQASERGENGEPRRRRRRRRRPGDSEGATIMRGAGYGDRGGEGRGGDRGGRGGRGGGGGGDQRREPARMAADPALAPDAGAVDSGAAAVASLEAASAPVAAERTSARGDDRGRGGRGRNGDSGRGGRGGGSGGGADRPRARIAPTDGREFWEAWADEKSGNSGVGEAVRPAGEAVRPAGEVVEGGDVQAEAPASAAPARSGRGRREREPREPREPEEAIADGNARLYINIGKRESATAEAILALVSGDLGDDAGRIGSIALRNTHAYVRVPEDLVDRVIEATKGKSYEGREVLIERARR